MREAVLQGFNEFIRRLAAFTEALGPILERWADWARSPEGQAALAMARAEAAMPRCHCLCGYKHHDKMGICQGVAITEALATSAHTGDVWMPLCQPCAGEWTAS